MACSKEVKDSTSAAYKELAAVKFPADEVKKLLDDSGASTLRTFLEDLSASLQVPLGTVFMGWLSLTAFQLHRTVAQYTSMLGVPPLPWPLRPPEPRGR